MKASTIIAVAAAVAGVSAQLSAIPQCALSCAITSLGSTGCGSTDIKCICQASGFVSALTPCVQSACSAADLEKTIQAATVLCASAGVSLSIPAATASTAAATTASSAAVTSAPATSATSAAYVSTTTEAASTLTTAVSSVYVSSNSTATTGAATTINSTVTTGSPTGTSSVPAPSGTGNAAGRNSVAIGGVVLAFAAALL